MSPMDDFNCPYCGEGFEVCYDDGHGMDESIRHEDECPHCQMAFSFTTELVFSHQAYRDCELNGDEHQFVRRWEGWLECDMCDEMKEVN